MRSEKGILSFGNSPGRNFYYDESLGDSLVEVWQNDFYGGFGNQSILAQNGNIFFADLGGRVFMADAETGKQLGYEENKGEIAVTPLIHQRRIIYGINDEDDVRSSIRFFDLIKGKENYSVTVEGYIANEFVKMNDGFIVLLQNGTLQKYSFLSRLIWELKTNEITQFDPAANEKYIVFGNQAGEVIVADTVGKLLSRKNISDGFESGAVVSQNLAYFGDNEGNLFCVTLPETEIQWQQKCSAKIIQIPILDETTLYVGDLSGKYYAFDLESGKLKWVSETGGLFNAPGLVFKDFIVQPDFSGRILIIDKANGEISKEFDYPNKVNFAPIYHDSKLFWGSYRSKIYSFERAPE